MALLDRMKEDLAAHIRSHCGSNPKETKHWIAVLGIDRSTLSDIRTGKLDKVSVDKLSRICEKIGYDRVCFVLARSSKPDDHFSMDFYGFQTYAPAQRRRRRGANKSDEGILPGAPHRVPSTGG